MKKNFFPFIYTLAFFLAATVFHMAIDGVQSNASKIKPEQEKQALYENLYTNLRLELSDGKTYELAKVQEPIVLLNFWASWCAPCMKEFKSLTKLKDKYADKILIIGINNDENDQKLAIRKTEEKSKLNFSSYADKESTMTSAFMITSIPATIVFYKGKYLYSHYEEMDFLNSEFISLLDSSLED